MHHSNDLIWLFTIVFEDLRSDYKGYSVSVYKKLNSFTSFFSFAFGAFVEQLLCRLFDFATSYCIDVV